MADVLTLDGLTKMGAFTGAPIKKTITWKKGEDEHSADVYVRLLSYHSTVAELNAFSHDHADAVAGRIASCICDAEGKPVFKPEDITGEADPKRGPLDGNLTIALLTVIAEVNRLGGSVPEPKT